MAMNKKEKAEFDAMKRAVRIARALNWTQPVPRDVPWPTSGEARGFVYSTYDKTIRHALSGSASHATGYEPPKKTSSQNPIPMFSTKLLALKALRHEVERAAANDLANIDEQIEAEIGGVK